MAIEEKKNHSDQTIEPKKSSQFADLFSMHIYHPSANTFFVAAKKPRYAKFVLCKLKM